jgi:hypothetical protein
VNRRRLFQGFAAVASGLLVPEPVRVYSFVGGWRGEPWGYAYWAPAGGAEIMFPIWNGKMTCPYTGTEAATFSLG